MRSLKSLVVPVLGMTVVLMAWSAKAETVSANLTGVSPWPGVYLSTQGGAANSWEYGGVGQLQWGSAEWRDGNTVGAGNVETGRTSSFWTYCVQAGPANTIGLGGPQVFLVHNNLETTADVIIGGDTASASAKAAKISQMFGWAKAYNAVASDFSTLRDDYKVGLQLAIWEVVYDGVESTGRTYDNTFGTGAGQFQAYGLSGYTDAWAAALDLLNNSDALHTVALQGLEDINGGTHQNQSIVAGAFGEGTVPLPGTAGAVLGLLTMTGLFRRNRA